MTSLLCRLIGCSSPFADRWSWPMNLCRRLLVLPPLPKRSDDEAAL